MLQPEGRIAVLECKGSPLRRMRGGDRSPVGPMREDGVEQLLILQTDDLSAYF